ncbi:MAG TPA: hypothetical protein DDZ76_02990 [Xanthomonadales bacterium]|nr:hypothetical protein [Xanthomonadales bacterium]
MFLAGGCRSAILLGCRCGERDPARTHTSSDGPSRCSRSQQIADRRPSDTRSNRQIDSNRNTGASPSG